MRFWKDRALLLLVNHFSIHCVQAAANLISCFGTARSTYFTIGTGTSFTIEHVKLFFFSLVSLLSLSLSLSLSLPLSPSLSLSLPLSPSLSLSPSLCICFGLSSLSLPPCLVVSLPLFLYDPSFPLSLSLTLSLSLSVAYFSSALSLLSAVPSFLHFLLSSLTSRARSRRNALLKMPCSIRRDTLASPCLQVLIVKNTVFLWASIGVTNV